MRKRFSGSGTRKKALRRAAQLYKSFREAPAKHIRDVKIKMPKALAVLGHVEFIGYATTHGHKTHLYIHTFAMGSRPLIAANTGRNQMVMVGGRYTVTRDGITDLDSNGSPIDAPARYKVTEI